MIFWLIHPKPLDSAGAEQHRIIVLHSPLQFIEICCSQKNLQFIENFRSSGNERWNNITCEGLWKVRMIQRQGSLTLRIREIGTDTSDSLDKMFPHSSTLLHTFPSKDKMFPHSLKASPWASSRVQAIFYFPKMLAALFEFVQSLKL